LVRRIVPQVEGNLTVFGGELACAVQRLQPGAKVSAAETLAPHLHLAVIEALVFSLVLDTCADEAKEWLSALRYRLQRAMSETTWKAGHGPPDAFEEAVELPQFVFCQHFESRIRYEGQQLKE
jgi:hypothetical protein